MGAPSQVVLSSFSVCSLRWWVTERAAATAFAPRPAAATGPCPSTRLSEPAAAVPGRGPREHRHRHDRHCERARPPGAGRRAVPSRPRRGQGCGTARAWPGGQSAHSRPGRGAGAEPSSLWRSCRSTQTGKERRARSGPHPPHVPCPAPRGDASLPFPETLGTEADRRRLPVTPTAWLEQTQILYFLNAVDFSKFKTKSSFSLIVRKYYLSGLELKYKPYYRFVLYSFITFSYINEGPSAGFEHGVGSASSPRAACVSQCWVSLHQRPPSLCRKLPPATGLLGRWGWRTGGRRASTLHRAALPWARPHPAEPARPGRWPQPACCMPCPREVEGPCRTSRGWVLGSAGTPLSPFFRLQSSLFGLKAAVAQQPLTEGPHVGCVRTGTCALLPRSEREPGLRVRLCAPRGGPQLSVSASVDSGLGVCWSTLVPWREHHSVPFLQSQNLSDSWAEKAGSQARS